MFYTKFFPPINSSVFILHLAFGLVLGELIMIFRPRFLSDIFKLVQSIFGIDKEILPKHFRATRPSSPSEFKSELVDDVDVEEAQTEPLHGSVRWNSDTRTLEVFTANIWIELFKQDGNGTSPANAGRSCLSILRSWPNMNSGTPPNITLNTPGS